MFQEKVPVGSGLKSVGVLSEHTLARVAPVDTIQNVPSSTTGCRQLGAGSGCCRRVLPTAIAALREEQDLAPVVCMPAHPSFGQIGETEFAPVPLTPSPFPQSSLSLVWSLATSCWLCHIPEFVETCSSKVLCKTLRLGNQGASGS